MATVSNCPVCGLTLDSNELLGNTYRLSCQRCGDYRVTGKLLSIGFPSATGAQRSGLMAALRTPF